MSEKYASKIVGYFHTGYIFDLKTKEKNKKIEDTYTNVKKQARNF